MNTGAQHECHFGHRVLGPWSRPPVHTLPVNTGIVCYTEHPCPQAVCTAP